MSVARFHDIVDSPLGPITLTAENDILSGLHFSAHRRGPSIEQLGPRRPSGLRAVTAWLDAYFAGEQPDFDLALVMRGTDFQQTVWSALRDIPFGATQTYGDLAARIGRPGAARAVGSANARNPISVIVPCHRVIGTGGSLTGYGGGIDRKRALLDLERAHLPAGFR
jgi:methylated-DNA-[protein]-cysteine S-methyltransferase